MNTPSIISHVTGVDGHLWTVTGSNNQEHIVTYDWDGWMCTCEDHYFRSRFCKHMKVCAEAENITDTTLGKEVLRA